MRKKSKHTRIKPVLWLLSLLLVIPMTYGLINTKSSAEPSAQSIQTVAQRGDKMNQISDKVQPCTAIPIDSKIEVDISEQQLYLYCRYAGGKEERKVYPVSTSKYGIGSQAGSNKTPLGLHYIDKKMGDGAPEGMIFKARRSTGKIAKMNAPGAGDLVTTRIMWLKGLEPGGNSGRGIDSYKRYIYIHGTAEENKIGEPASHGCIRMYNSDVIDLFERVTEGVEVNIKR
ncbi:MAG: L,D-transpeptidase [Thiomargarita sp.]|nr:L,D-transpeptidase [Thiomargarita sp.]